MAKNKWSKSSGNLVNDLSIADARHIIKCEGGELTIGELLIEIATSLMVAGALARAIWVGDATAWHLFLPMVAQYLALIIAIPALYIFFRHPGLRKDVVGSLRLWAFMAIASGVAFAVQTYRSVVPWREQLSDNFTQAWRWIYDAQMHWPIVLAVAAILWGLPRRIRNLYEHGPPFSGVSLGCAMRLIVPLLGAFLVPFVASGELPVVWVLWAIILLADFLALAMHWDLQRRLRKFDAQQLKDERTTL